MTTDTNFPPDIVPVFQLSTVVGGGPGPNPQAGQPGPGPHPAPQPLPKQVGEYTAPLLLACPLTTQLGVNNLNKGAATQGLLWAGVSALGGPVGAALGGLAGY